MPQSIAIACRVAGSKAPDDSVAAAINSMKNWLCSDAKPGAVNKLASCQQATSPCAVFSQIDIPVSPDNMNPNFRHGGFVKDQSSVPSHFQEHRGSETSLHTPSLPLEHSDSSHNVTGPGQQSSGPAGECAVFIKGNQDENTERLPAPLHIIEATTSHGNIAGRKPKRSKDTWSVSDLEDAKIGQKDSSGASMISLPLSSKLENTFIGLWTMNIAKPPNIVYLPKDPTLPAFRQCDIDACTGRLLSPTSYPETIQSGTQGLCRDYRDIGWRQANMTSELQIVRELKSRQRLGEHLRVSFHQNQLIKAPVEVPPFEEDSFPSVECTLRPAMPADFARIAEIINLESQKEDCPQVLESKPVSMADIEGIFKYCRTNLRPFIVAIPTEEDILDRSKWPKNSERAYQQYVKFKKAQPHCPPVVVGFAFVGETRIGFLDAPCPGSRYSGQVRVIVHPEHRRQSYGTALLDRTLLSLSSNHSNLIAHEWRCPAPAHVYESPVRQYARVYVEMYCESKDTADFKWRAKMLGKFNFDEVAHLRQVVRTDRDGKSKWLDLVLWEFEASTTSAIRDAAPGSHLTPY